MTEPGLTHESPHHNARKGPIRLVVLHADASPSEKGTLSWLTDPASKVSYHVLIGRHGGIYRLVPESRRAWHAGVSAWPGIADVNGASLGLSFANRHDGTEALTPLQMASAQSVIAEWRAKYPTIEAVTTHAAVAPGRKSDPLKAVGFRLEDFA
jgi:N-acetylmuramoyl-L-alanine amidase